MKKIKVLIDLRPLRHLSSGLGQVSLNYATTVANLNPDDMDITFFVPDGFMGKFGNNVHYLKYKKIYSYFPFLLPSFDIWHHTSQRIKYLPVNKGVKQIITIHDLNFLYEEEAYNGKRALKRLQSRVNVMSRIFCISDFVVSDVKKHLDLKGKPISKIANGVQFLDPASAVKPQFKQSERKFFFTIGQICEKKNFHVLLDLMKLMPEYDLYIAGENNRDYALEMQVRIDVEKIQNVFLPGVISPEEKIWMYKHCEAFLFPSKFEGFGLPIIEAMEFGRAVFSSRCTCLEETGGSFAYYWDNFSADHMKNVISSNLENFYNDKQKIEAEKKYAFSFSYEKHTKRYFEEYRKLAKEK